MPSTNSAAANAIVAYVPAIHAGYIQFFNKHAGAPIFVLGKSFIDNYPRLNRDLRALRPEEAVQALQALGYQAAVLEVADVAQPPHYSPIIVPDEDVSHDFAEKYLQGHDVRFESIFLRWDGTLPDRQKELSPDRTASVDERDRAFMGQAGQESKKSADWWRQIGAVLVKDGNVVYNGHTRYFPSDHALDIFGTPRSNYDAGQRPDVYISMHAEADIIAQAAAAGVSTKGASLYVTTFPCINCAFLIVRSGIKKVFYQTGYSHVDSEGVLKSAGVEIILVSGA